VFTKVLSLKKVFKKKEWYRVGTGGNEAPFRNINFIPNAHFFEKNALARKHLKALHSDSTGRVSRKELLWGMKTNHTLQFLGAQKWWKSIFKLTAHLYHAFGVPTNVNVYITPQGRTRSLMPHNDFTCNFMFQLAGRKRWKLWVTKEHLMPTNEKFIYGRDQEEQLTEASLGDPYMDVVIGPGDILYVPRGVFHSTSTELPPLDDPTESRIPSMHMTTQVRHPKQ
jgi:ribosomal protein L16 Arg81 hydroxylase